MLTQIDVVYVNEQAGEQALALPILGVTLKESLLLRKVTGLNPPDLDLFIGDYSRDGGIYQGRRVGRRHVVLTIDLNPNPAFGETVAGLRDLLYRTFMDPLIDGDHVELVLRSDDGRVRNLYGYTEKFEADLFDMETLVQIDMVCPDPYIYDLNQTVLTNSSGTWTSLPFEYNGTSEAGLNVEIHISANTSGLVLILNGRSMSITHPLLAGDIVYINTNRGSRDITYKRAGVTYPLVHKLASSSRWLDVHQKANTISVVGPNLVSTIGGIKTLKFRSTYWGV